MLKALFTRRLFLTACALGLAGCTVHKTEAPDLAGPSEFSLAYTIAAKPDTITQDGGSQAAIVVTAFDANGSPKPSTTFRLDILVGGVPADYGALSNKNPTTGSNGMATVFYTAPPALPPGSDTPTCGGLPGGCVSIAATAVDDNFYSSHTELVTVRLLPIGTVLPPAGTPSAGFTFAPGSPAANTPVAFDGGTSCADVAASACSPTGLSFAWDFGDGGSASGRAPSHTYSSARTYNVTLTVTNSGGKTNSTSKPVTVGAGAEPKADFEFSPTPVVMNNVVYFDASKSRPSAGHTIVANKWTFGDGGSAANDPSPLAQHTFTSPGTYTVTLTATDEAGQFGTASKTITVTAGNPTANFTFVLNGTVADFDGRSSTAVGAATIASYQWSFPGSTSSLNVTTATPQATYPAGTANYNVSLTVVDSTGKVSATTTKVVAIP